MLALTAEELGERDGDRLERLRVHGFVAATT
jgi:hypothetical protein